MAELSSENIENHPKSRDNNVTKSMAGGVGGASHSGLKRGEKTHFAPGSKRSFDVAFLAGSDDSNNKSAFTKYNNKERKVEKDVTISSMNTNLAENTSNTVDSNTTSSMILPNVSNPNLNMLQFPALRKLLDITGAASSFKSTAPLAIPSLAVPPVPPEVANLATSILPPTLALGLGPSNTCAKCGVTFRMTSDLVYHMRTHHSKLNPTSYEKRREGDRLKCNVCGENFRERHHLTRHMTAHQDRNENPPPKVATGSNNKPEVKTTSPAVELVTAGLQIQDLNPLLPALLLPKGIKDQQQHKDDKPEVQK